MATLLSAIETQVRRHLDETTASFWTSAELTDIQNRCFKDLWRDIVDLKEEHFLTVDSSNVSLSANTATLSGVPTDVHKVYLIEPVDTTSSGTHKGLIFKPVDYNHDLAQGARSRSNVEPSNDVLYYSVTGAGSPTGSASTVIYIAPKVSSAIAATAIRFVYVPTLADKLVSENNPIPGESDNAVIAWTVAFARAKEREDRSPDPNWLAIYSTEKQHLMQSLGVRQLQEPKFVDAMFEKFWG